MNLPLRAWTVVVVAALGGVATLALALVHIATKGLPAGNQVTIAGVFGLLVAASWIKPLIVYVKGESKAIHLDEAFFVVFVLLVRPDLTIAVYALAVLMAQVINHRPLAKSAFNFGQMLISVSVGVGVFALLDQAPGTVDYRDLGAAIVAVAAYFIVNNGAVAGILAATNVPWREALFDGLEVHLLFEVSGVAISLGAALVISEHAWAIPVAIVPLLMLRQVLVGHFDARHDRARFEGLYKATLDINRSMGTVDVENAITSSARDLLRCSEAVVTDAPSDPGDAEEHSALSTVLDIAGRRLELKVSGRSRTEPFDGTDKGLLDALTAVGAAALSNATLFEESRFQRQRLAAITSSLGEGVCAVSRSGHITFMNPAAATMLGQTVDSELADYELTPGLDIGPRAPSYILAPAMRAISNCDTITSYDTRFQRADGSYFHVAFTVSPIFDTESASEDEEQSGAAREPSGAVLVFRDITERKVLEEQLARHAFHDALTGLPNRRLFLDHLEHALRRSKRSNEQHAVLFADVDRFKLINDGLGHHAGDQLLIAIGEKLRAALRPGDVLARFGGDEFTVLLEGVESLEDPINVAQRILDNVSEPIPLPDGHEVVASMSIGLTITSAEKTRDDVLHDADVAMYQAKARGRGGHYEVFDIEAMGVRSAERIELEAALRRALDRDELEVFYQPLFSLSDRRVVSTEALVRWNHPTRGLLSPDQFIGLAEDTGLILRLGWTVLEKACRQVRAWRDRYGVKLSIGINLSPRQFQQAGLADDLEEILQSTGMDPSQLLLEITESLAADRAEQTTEILMRLKALGCQVAIDDFGTGYSALGYLADFPIDVVKVDRSFIEGVDVDPVKSAIVSAVVTLSKAIGTITVVEGVETEGQVEHLHSLGCDVAQGYFFARPMSSAEFESRFLVRSQEAGTTEQTQLVPAN